MSINVSETVVQVEGHCISPVVESLHGHLGGFSKAEDQITAIGRHNVPPNRWLSVGRPAFTDSNIAIFGASDEASSDHNQENVTVGQITHIVLSSRRATGSRRAGLDAKRMVTRERGDHLGCGAT
jgi:hypothetical protein